MIKIIRFILREPLFHFLVLGALLYLYYVSVQTEVPQNQKSVIKISSYEIQKIKSDYKKEYNKEPNEVVLKALVNKKYHDKVLLNEAYLLELEKQDEVISQRLLKKIHFIMQNSSKITEPTEEELEEYYKKHIADYSVINSLSFSNVFFKPDRDKKAIEDTLKLLQTDKISPQEALYFSDTSSLKSSFSNATYKEIESAFGKYFANKLFSMRSGIWHEPLHSKIGTHLVYITDKNISEPYPFEDVQGRVYEDFMKELKSNILEKAYKRILSAYTLEVE